MNTYATRAVPPAVSPRASLRAEGAPPLPSARSHHISALTTAIVTSAIRQAINTVSELHTSVAPSPLHDPKHAGARTT